MRRSVTLWSLLAVLLGGLSASAQVAPPPVEDQAASTARAAEPMVTNLPENLPGLLGFTVRSKSTYIKRRHQVVRYTTSDPFEASAQRLYKLKLDGTTAREVAMHVAAMNPQYVRREEVPQEIVAKEKEIMLAQMGDMKKPPEVMEKIVTGKIGKFFTEVCLEDQLYVRDPDGKSTVGAWLKKIDGSIRIDSFVRMQVGEGIEKRKD